MPFKRLPDSPTGNQRFLFTSSSSSSNVANSTSTTVVNAAEKLNVKLDLKEGQRLDCIRIYSLISKPGLEYPLSFNFPSDAGLQQPFPESTATSEAVPYLEGGIKVHLDATLNPVMDIYLHTKAAEINVYNSADPNNFYQGIIEFNQGGFYA